MLVAGLNSKGRTLFGPLGLKGDCKGTFFYAETGSWNAFLTDL